MIGSPMAERFLFMPSLGFCMVLTFLIFKILKVDSMKIKFVKVKHFFSTNYSLFTIIVFILGFYSLQTFSRSMDWKDNVKLFSHDVFVSDKSARAHYSWGKALSWTVYTNEKDQNLKKVIMDSAIKEFDKAIKIYDSYAEAYNEKGCALEELGRHNEAISAFIKTLEINPNSYEAIQNLGAVYGIINQNEKALEYYKKAIEMDPNDEENYKCSGLIYQKIGDLLKAKEYLEKANRLANDQQK
jgi:tetratricopeptide (TPR) repeat protein